MLELRNRNGKKHIVAKDELNAFAWAGYYANYSEEIILNGKEYKVIHAMNCAIDLKDGTHLPFGCYTIFEGEECVRFFDYYKLEEIRKNNPLEGYSYCFDDNTFLKIV